MQLVLDTNGLLVRKRNNSFWVSSKTEKRTISPHRISSIAVTADCLISSAAIRLAAQHKIPIYFFNAAAKIEARMWSPGFGSLAKIRRKQMEFIHSPEATRWVIGLFQEKLRQQEACMRLMIKKRRSKALLQTFTESLDSMKETSKKFEGVASTPIRNVSGNIMGIEGNIAKVYWRFLSASLPKSYVFPKRSRRPALDPFNASLNYLYGMLYSVTEGAALAAGLDTHVGFLHADEYNKPTFVFDLIEPFRPWVDKLLVQVCLEGKLQERFFEEIDDGIWIAKAGKRFLIPLFNDYMNMRIMFNGRRLSRKNHIYRYAGEFAQGLLNEIL